MVRNLTSKNFYFRSNKIYKRGIDYRNSAIETESVREMIFQQEDLVKKSE